MRIVKVGVLAPTNKGIPLGVQGENRATKVEFDTRPWFREYPYGTVSAVARRDGDPAPYPLTLEVADGTAVWKVSDTDTAKAGEGAVELTITSAGARVRSLTFKTLVTASLTDSPVDDDAWYGWLDKAVVKVDETVQSAQRKMDEVDLEWNALKADVTYKVEELGEVAAQAASDAHHAKVDAQATAKALESAEGSVAKAEAAANRAVDAALAADDSAVEASRSALSAGESAESAAGSATNAARSASEAATSASNAADAASAASGSASASAQSATDANSAKVAAQTAKADAATSASNAATSASNAESSATAAAKSASDAAASVNAINVISPLRVNANRPAVASSEYALAIGRNAKADTSDGVAIGPNAHAIASAVALGTSSVANMNGTISIGNDDTKRRIMNVAGPTYQNDAANKKYTDDNDANTLSEAKKYTDENDAKTLSEAKNYTDANTSNALVGNVSGKLLHVEDAWPGKPLGLTIDGAYKQDGTPSPENPVPITVIENPVLKVTGRNLLDFAFPARYASYSSGIAIIHPSYVDNPTVTLPYTSIASSDGFGFVCRLAAGRTYTIKAFNLTVGEHAVAVSGYADKADVADKSKAVWHKPETRLSSPVSFTVQDGGEWVVFCFAAIWGDGTNKVTYPADFKASVECGGTVADFVPYTVHSLDITLPAEHPYLAALPDGTHDEIRIDAEGNVELVARVGKLVFDNQKKWWGIQAQPGGYSLGYSDILLTSNGLKKRVGGNVLSDKFKANSTWINEPSVGVSGVLWVVPKTNDGNITAEDIADAVAGSCLYAPLDKESVYKLGKVTVPSLPETISNVWTDAELTTNMSITYKRDINVAFDNLAQAVVASAAGE